MRDIEDIIKEKNGHENPFRVPEGYFNDLTSRIMAQLPADEPVVGETVGKPALKVTRRRQLWKPLVACAASVAAVVFSVAIIMNDGSEEAAAMANEQTESNSAHDQFVDEVADYAMMDNADIIACLNDE